MRRENAKSGGGMSEVVGFDCFSLCMTCGYLAEPARGDPMRTETVDGKPVSCPACGRAGLADLRHTPTVFSLNELERSEDEPSRLARFGRVFGRALGIGIAGAILVGSVAMVIDGSSSIGDGLDRAALAVGPIAVVSLPVVAPLLSGSAVIRRAKPRRWRLPQVRQFDRAPWSRKRVRGTARASSELLTAPLSGRPCLAYEIGVRDDDGATAVFR
jgi:hypothetical protein